VHKAVFEQMVWRSRKTLLSGRQIIVEWDQHIKNGNKYCQSEASVTRTQVVKETKPMLHIEMGNNRCQSGKQW